MLSWPSESGVSGLPRCIGSVPQSLAGEGWLYLVCRRLLRKKEAVKPAADAAPAAAGRDMGGENCAAHGFWVFHVIV